jgi:hypothetical protein
MPSSFAGGEAVHYPDSTVRKTARFIQNPLAPGYPMGFWIGDVGTPNIFLGSSLFLLRQGSSSLESPCAPRYTRTETLPGW